MKRNRRDDTAVVNRVWVINELSKITRKANEVQVPDKHEDCFKAATDIARIFNNGIAELSTKIAHFEDLRKED